MVNLSNSLAGLSLITGANAFSALGGGISFESRAVRLAKAQFDAPPTTPPWKQEPDARPISAQLSAIKLMRTIIDRAGTGVDTLPGDIQTAFTTYKALDRLRILAEAATAKTSSDAQRKQLQTAFSKGLGDLETFLSSAPSDKVNIAFDKTARLAKTVGLPAPSKYALETDALVKQRADALPGLTGQERFTISLSKTGANDQVTVDLAAGPQPPTLDSVAEAINSAIAAVPMRNSDGSVYLDANGETKPRWLVRFEPTKMEEGWGLTVKTSTGTERISIEDDGAKNSLVVAAGQTPLDSPTATRVFRIDDPAGDPTRTTLTSISARDRVESERVALLDKATTTIKTVTGKDGKETVKLDKTSEVAADTSAAAIAADGWGNSYIVGTTAGDLDAIRSDGDDNLFLTKVDAQGKIVWQRSLGAAGSSEGAAVVVGTDGSVTVAGTVNGSFGSANTDGDMVVARFSADGEEQFATVVRRVGADSAAAVAVGADGSVFVGGRSSGNGGDAFLAKIDATGRLVDRRMIDEGGSERITALATDADGNLVAVINQNGNAQVRRIDSAAIGTDLASIDLGQADARALAIGSDGTIAVGGTTTAALGGTQVNATGGGRDGFVARIDAGMTGSSVTYLATAEEDRVDSLAFMDGDLYAGGRTNGALGAARTGATDGFVARIDPATGAIENTTQFGQPLLRTEPVQVAAAPKAVSAVNALGFSAGTINPPVSERLVDQTALRPGDTFSVRVNDGALRKIVISKDDTLTSLADRLRKITGSKFTITTPLVDGKRALSILAKPGNELDLVAGAEGLDALGKLGLPPQRVSAPPAVDDDAPRVRPGGNYGLGLTHALSLATLDDAKVALKKIKEAVSMSQTAYRSLYWDDSKAVLADPKSNNALGSGNTARANAQLANYQAALDRLSNPSATAGFF